jgi:hypothetical protein
MKPSASIPQNASVDEAVRALFDYPVSREHNIARLRPKDLPKHQRFETVKDVRERHAEEVGRFKKIEGLNFLAEHVEACTPEAPCLSVSCPICARRFRRWIIGQALPFCQLLDLQWATVAIELVPVDKPFEQDLLSLKRRTAQRIRRAARSVSFVLGGIEAEYRCPEKAFLVHGHFLISRLSKDEEKRLRAAFQCAEIPRAVKIDELNDPVRQISYTFKFPNYFRPGKQTGPFRPRAIPLPDGPLMDLAIWRAQYSFLDFTFLMGLRRRGGELVRISQND